MFPLLSHRGKKLEREKSLVCLSAVFPVLCFSKCCWAPACARFWPGLQRRPNRLQLFDGVHSQECMESVPYDDVCKLQCLVLRVWACLDSWSVSLVLSSSLWAHTSRCAFLLVWVSDHKFVCVYLVWLCACTPFCSFPLCCASALLSFFCRSSVPTVPTYKWAFLLTLVYWMEMDLSKYISCLLYILLVNLPSSPPGTDGHLGLFQSLNFQISAPRPCWNKYFLFVCSFVHSFFFMSVCR